MEASDMKTIREALEAILKEANTQYRNDNGIDLEWLMAKAKAALAETATTEESEYTERTHT